MIITLTGPDGLDAILDQPGTYWVSRSSEGISVNRYNPKKKQLIATPRNTISRTHLQILVETDLIILTDTNSTNHSRLNGTKFTTQEIRGPGVYVLTLADVDFELRCESSPSTD